MAELAMLERTVYPEKVTRQLHVMAQARESSPVIERRPNHCATPPSARIDLDGSFDSCKGGDEAQYARDGDSRAKCDVVLPSGQ